MSCPKETADAYGTAVAEKIEDYLDASHGRRPSIAYIAGMEEAARVCAWHGAVAPTPNSDYERGFLAACAHMANVIRDHVSEEIA